MGNADYGIGRHSLLQMRKVKAFSASPCILGLSRARIGMPTKESPAPGNEIPRMKEAIVDFDVSCRVMKSG
jgi:hypothetical protein